MIDVSPGRLPSQIPGFGEKPNEWIVEAITTRHGKGVRSELMGVEDPQGSSPASYPRLENVTMVSACAAGLVGDRYIRTNGDEGDTHPSTHHGPTTQSQRVG